MARVVIPRALDEETMMEDTDDVREELITERPRTVEADRIHARRAGTGVFDHDSSARLLFPMQA